MGEILAVVGIVVAIAGIVELERLRRTIRDSLKWYQDPVSDLATGARTYHWRNRARQSPVRTRDGSREVIQIDAEPAKQHRLRVRRVQDDSGGS